MDVPIQIVKGSCEGFLLKPSLFLKEFLGHAGLCGISAVKLNAFTLLDSDDKILPERMGGVCSFPLVSHGVSFVVA